MQHTLVVDRANATWVCVFFRICHQVKWSYRFFNGFSFSPYRNPNHRLGEYVKNMMSQRSNEIGAVTYLNVKVLHYVLTILDIKNVVIA